MLRRAFTLIELLVVTAIIAMLISILLPALGRAKAVALQVTCAANLHSWGQALYEYANDNGGAIMGSRLDNPCLMGGDNWHQCFIYMQTTPHDLNEINVERLQPYLGNAVDLDSPGWMPLSPGDAAHHGAAYIGEPANFRLSKVWLCPAATNVNVLQGQPWFAPGWTFATWHVYAYYGRVGQWPVNATHYVNRPDDIMDATFSGDRVMLSDSTYVFSGQSAGWHYNHARLGQGFPQYNDSTQPNGNFDGISSVQYMTGMNVGYGDGHVEWRTANTAEMQQAAIDQSTSYPLIRNANVSEFYGGQP